MKFEARVKFEASRTRSTVNKNLGPVTKKFAIYARLSLCIHKSQSDALFAGSSGTTNAMHVIIVT